jgi:hypothetical protein
VITITYQHECSYRDLGTGEAPVLALSVSMAANSRNTIDVDAHLDSGAEVSLFNGFIIPSLGGELLNSNRKSFRSTAGDEVIAYLHRVRIVVPEIGNFDWEIGFSDRQIRRNLLGRDFFNRVQIGFRENHLKYYLNPSP